MALPKRRSAYHRGNGCGVWRNRRDLEGKYIGVEYEVESSTGRWQDLAEKLPAHDDEKDGYAPAFETDGSLSAAAGIEMIFPPVPTASLRDPKSYLPRCIAAIKKSGLARFHRNTGMHMNINTTRWGGEKKSVFVALIHWMPRATLEKLGGRTLNHYCSQDQDYDSIYEYRNEPPPEHANAVEHRQGRVECRFPAATDDVGALSRLSYFFDYLEDFASTFTPQAVATLKPKELFPLFVKWLKEHHEKDAAILAEFLS